MKKQEYDQDVKRYNTNKKHENDEYEKEKRGRGIENKDKNILKENMQSR